MFFYSDFGNSYFIFCELFDNFLLLIAFDAFYYWLYEVIFDDEVSNFNYLFTFFGLIPDTFISGVRLLFGDIDFVLTYFFTKGLAGEVVFNFDAVENFVVGFFTIADDFWIFDFEILGYYIFNFDFDIVEFGLKSLLDGGL